MTQATTQPRRKLGLSWCFVLLCLLSPVQSLAAEYFFYGPTPKVLQAKLKQSGLHWQQLEAQAASLNSTKKSAPKILVVLGKKALASAAQLSQQADITLLAYLNQSQYQQQLDAINRLKNPSVYLRNSPQQRQLHLLKLLLPHHKRIGVLCSVHSCSDLQALQDYAKQLDLDLITQPVDKNTLGSKLNLLLNQSDSLLAIQDKSIYNSASIGNILLSSYRRNKPLVGLSPAYVKAGVLASSYASGEQYQDHLLKLLHTFANAPQQRQKMYFCPDFDIHINRRVAHSMDLILPLKSALKPLLSAREPYEKL